MSDQLNSGWFQRVSNSTVNTLRSLVNSQDSSSAPSGRSSLHSENQATEEQPMNYSQSPMNSQSPQRGGWPLLRSARQEQHSSQAHTQAAYPQRVDASPEAVYSPQQQHRYSRIQPEHASPPQTEDVIYSTRAHSYQDAQDQSQRPSNHHQSQHNARRGHQVVSHSGATHVARRNTQPVHREPQSRAPRHAVPPQLSPDSSAAIADSMFFASELLLGSGMAIIQPSTGKVVVVHMREAETEYWFLPKGRKDVGESLEQAALREAYEEVSRVYVLPDRWTS